MIGNDAINRYLAGEGFIGALENAISNFGNMEMELT
jgi:hypothetical protein